MQSHCNFQFLHLLTFVVLVHDRGRFFPMNPHMFLEVPALAEAFATDVAHIGSLASVQPGVDYHLVPLGESFGTILTRVRPGVRMDPLVFSHQVSSLKYVGHILKRQVLVGLARGVSPGRPWDSMHTGTAALPCARSGCEGPFRSSEQTTIHTFRIEMVFLLKQFSVHEKASRTQMIAGYQ